MKILWVYCIIVKSLSIDFRKRKREKMYIHKLGTGREGAAWWRHTELRGAFKEAAGGFGTLTPMFGSHVKTQPVGMIHTTTTGNVQSHEAAAITTHQISESLHEEERPEPGRTNAGHLGGTIYILMFFLRMLQLDKGADTDSWIRYL